MATYQELHELNSDTALKNRVVSAVIIAAETVMSEDGGTTNHANRLVWAKGVFANPTGEAKRMFMAVLAANKDSTVEQITSASDAAIQTNVDAHIDLFADGS